MRALPSWLRPEPRRHAPARLGLGAPGLLLLTACTETALDATLLETDDAPIVTDVPGCLVREPELEHVYAIVSKPTGRCLHSGEVTTIEGTLTATGYTIELVDCDSSPEQEWLLLGTANQLQIQNVLLALNVDLEGANYDDGTEALLFYPHGNRNQLFRLNPLADGSQEIRAIAPESSCLE